MTNVLTEQETNYWIEASVNMNEDDFENEIAKLSPEKRAAVNKMIADIYFPPENSAESSTNS